MGIIGDVEELKRDVDALSQRIEKERSISARHEEQINGERGLSAAINTLAEEVRALRRAMWVVGGGIVVASVGFGFGVLQLI